MRRSIPPKTISRIRRGSSKGRNLSRLGFDISLPPDSGSQMRQEILPQYKGKVYKKPREWRYITKPFFKRIKEPIVDIFKEAEEVQIIIDLGNFRKGELNFGLENRKYCISGKHEDCEFREEILLPYDVDIKKIKENFRNDILKLILPKKDINKMEKKNEK